MVTHRACWDKGLKAQEERGNYRNFDKKQGVSRLTRSTLFDCAGCLLLDSSYLVIS